MTDFFSPLLQSTFSENNTLHNVSVEAIVDDDSEYTGRYRVTIDGNITTELIWNSDDSWSEKDKGKTKTAAIIGELIATHVE